MITKKEYQQICLLYNNGMSSIKIAKQYNCSYQTICKILKQNNIKIREPSYRKRTHYLLNEDYFQQIDSPEKAYILGYFYADAYNNTDGYQIKLTLNNQDLEILQKFSNIFYGKEKLYHHNDKISSLVIYSKKMSIDLHNQGCIQAKTFKIKFPPLQKNLISHFIRGYFDGDGCLSINIKNKCAVVNIISTLQFVSKIQKILKTTLGINSSIRQQNKIYYIYIMGNRQVLSFLNFIYNDTKLFLKRKYDKYQEFLSLVNSLNKNKVNNFNINNVGIQ